VACNAGSDDEIQDGVILRVDRECSEEIQEDVCLFGSGRRMGGAWVFEGRDVLLRLNCNGSAIHGC
jgi:hypothetical protein